jgi:hypothetical protein
MTTEREVLAELVQKIDALAEKATRGTIKTDRSDHQYSLAVFAARAEGVRAYITRYMTTGDAELYAALRNAWPQIREVLARPVQPSDVIVNEEMIEAGAYWLDLYDPGWSSDSEYLTKIFTAMEAARPVQPDARGEALEEAAMICDALDGYDDRPADCASAIRRAAKERKCP